MAYFHVMACCALKEIADLNLDLPFEETMLSFALDTRSLMHSNNTRLTSGAIVFTANIKTKNNYAVKFAENIEKHKLGSVIAIPQFVNPNTHSTISMFVWVIDQPATFVFLRELKARYKSVRF